jgi:ATP-dependent Clp protease ATP-binding subunit ClpA
MEFDAARAAAQRMLEEAADIHAVDVLAARPPHGDVRPVRLAHDAAVRAAFWAGEDLRRRLRARSRETLHLLYGLCATGAPLTHRLLHGCGGSADAILRILESSLPEESHHGPSTETQSYRVCLETARLNARGRGAAAVEEGDVLWAVLDSPSRNVRKVVEAAGSDCSVLLAALTREWRRSREATISRHFVREAE